MQLCGFIITLFYIVSGTSGSSDNNAVLCDSPDGTTGICYTSEDCAEAGGTALAACEDDGVCCLVERSCRNVTTDELAYFVNPSYPNQDRIGSFCDFRIDVSNEDVCQIRIDFEQFSIVGPHRTMGICRYDRFLVTTSLPNGFGLSELCGENSGQHIYVPVDASIGSASVSLMVMTSGSKSYHWRIRTAQIDCKEHPQLVAPAGCLQYHTQLAGDITSFNYDGGAGHYQTNLDYAICILRSPNTCRMEYDQVENSKFWIDSADGDDIPDGVGRAGTSSCDLTTHDYLHIADGRGGDGDGSLSASSSDKFCGRSLSGLAIVEESDRLLYGGNLQNLSTASTVTSYTSGPIVLRFHSDDVTVPEREVGFHIKYKQQGTSCQRT